MEQRDRPRGRDRNQGNSGGSRGPSTPRGTLPTEIRRHVDNMGLAAYGLRNPHNLVHAAHELYDAYLPIDVDKDESLSATLFAAENGRIQQHNLDVWGATPESEREGDRPVLAPIYRNAHANLVRAQVAYAGKRDEMRGDLTGAQLNLLYTAGDNDLGFEVPENVAAAVRSAGKLETLQAGSASARAIGVLDEHRIQTVNGTAVENYLARRALDGISNDMGSTVPVPEAA